MNIFIKFGTNEKIITSDTTIIKFLMLYNFQYELIDGLIIFRLKDTDVSKINYIIKMKEQFILMNKMLLNEIICEEYFEYLNGTLLDNERAVFIENIVKEANELYFKEYLPSFIEKYEETFNLIITYTSSL